MKYLNTRIEKTMDSVLQKADAMFITDNVNRRYVFGFDSSAGFGYISKNKCLLYLDSRYFEKAKIQQSRGGISSLVSIFEMDKPIYDILKNLVAEDNTQKLLYENRRMTCFEYSILKKKIDNVTLCEADGLIEIIRAAKDDYEITRICDAQKITDDAFKHICLFIKRGMTEKEIVLELEYFMRKNGADDVAFNTICVSGTKSSMPHGEPDNTVVDNGFLTLDFGAKRDGYCSDMTRTLCIGNPTSEMRTIYDTVLNAQESAFAEIKPGVTGKTVDLAARNVIYNAGYKGCFGHSTGHSIGLEVHESPNFSPREERIIPAGAVLSVEPGIYLEGKCGVRIEDLVFLTENGYKNLTNSTKEFIILR